MQISQAFLRIFFGILSVFFLTTFAITLPLDFIWQKISMGIGIGILFLFILVGFENLFKKYSLRAFNTTILGIFFGYLLGKGFILLFNSFLDLSHLNLVFQPKTIEMIHISLLLLSTYLGASLILHFSDELQVSIPFIKFSPLPQRKKDLILDISVLYDSRIIDLALSGLLDHLLIVPRFVVKELQAQSEMGEETHKNKARKCLETVKKLENISDLGLRYHDTDFHDLKDSFQKLTRLARLIDANLFTGDITEAQIPLTEGIKLINLHALSNALKPIMQAGESMRIKVQRYGKEPNQGVGYLDDGTMVVVNGGGDFIGENIYVQVLSVKHTSSGRMIFCNAFDDLPAKGNRVEL